MNTIRLITIGTISSLLAMNAIAQTTLPPTRPILDVAKEKAAKNLSATRVQLNNEIDKAEGYDPCKINFLRASEKSDQWFLDHIAKIDALSSSIDTIIAAANEKIETLSTQTVSVNPVQDQTNGEVSVSLGKMIDYFKLYNARIKTCSKDAQSELAKQMEDPRNNKLGVAHSQIVTAMGLMTTNLNASLKSLNTTFRLTFSPSSCGYNLDLEVSIKMEGLNQNYSFSLLGAGSSSTLSKIKLGDAEKWAALSKSNAVVDGLPLDGLKRFEKILKEERGSCAYPKLISGYKAFVPYLTASEVAPAIAKMKLEKQTGASSHDELLNIDFVQLDAGRYLKGASTIEISSEFEMQISEVTQRQWFNIMKDNPSTNKTLAHCPASYSADGGGMCQDFPVETLDASRVQEFIVKLNGLSQDFTYALPTEEQWQYAADGAPLGEIATEDQPWKNSVNNVLLYGWFLTNSQRTDGIKTESAVMKKLPNSLGIYDLYGNVWELTSTTHPVPNETHTKTIVKGLSYKDDPSTGVAYLDRTGNHHIWNHVMNYENVGFRLIRTRK